MLRLKFQTTVIHWRGPSPFFFAPIPTPHVPDINRSARSVSYGWGMIPVAVSIAGVTFTTALFPKDDGYLLPIKAAVRNRIGVTVGDDISVEMTIGAPVPPM